MNTPKRVVSKPWDSPFLWERTRLIDDCRSVVTIRQANARKSELRFFVQQTVRQPRRPLALCRLSFQWQVQEIACLSPDSHYSGKSGSGFGAWHTVCSSQKSLVAATMSFRQHRPCFRHCACFHSTQFAMLGSSLIPGNATMQQIPGTKRSGLPALCSRKSIRSPCLARLRSQRLRFGFLLSRGNAHSHAAQKSCTVRIGIYILNQFAPAVGTRRKPVLTRVSL
jgi:hypothetical protein